MKIQKQAFLAHSSTIDQDYRIFYYSDIKNPHLYPHSHNFYEMYLLVSGKVMYKTEGNDFFLRPGDILFINTEQRHCPVLIDSNVPYERIVLHVSPSVLKSLSNSEINLAECFTRDNYVVYHFPQDVQNNIRLILGNLFSIQESSRFGHKLLARAYLTELYVEINQYNHDKSIYILSDEMKDSQMLALIKQYIMEHLDENITIESLASYVCLTKYHFMHTFKRLTGKSAYQYILKLRLEAARSLIQKGVSLTMASQQCGFGDYSSFYRFFRREYGQSPSDYFK